MILVVTDEGCNSSKAVFADPIGGGYDPNETGLIFRLNDVAKVHFDPYGNLMCVGGISNSHEGGLQFKRDGNTIFSIKENGSIAEYLCLFGYCWPDINEYHEGTVPSGSIIIKNQTGKRIAIAPDGELFISGGRFTGADLSGF